MKGRSRSQQQEQDDHSQDPGNDIAAPVILDDGEDMVCDERHGMESRCPAAGGHFVRNQHEDQDTRKKGQHANSIPQPVNLPFTGSGQGHQQEQQRKGGIEYDRGRPEGQSAFFRAHLIQGFLIRGLRIAGPLRIFH